jgi:hypothetical protein
VASRLSSWKQGSGWDTVGRHLGIPSYPISSCSSQPSSEDYDSVGNKKCLIGCCPAEAAPHFPGRGWKTG